MARILFFGFLLLPFLGQSQCSVSLGDDVLQCNGNPVTLSAIHIGMSSPDSLRIVYDATQGVTGLTSASEVYFHSGVQTVPFGGWEYTIGNWGQNDGVGRMTALGNNLWQITIHVPSYYNYPGGTNVIGLWMVFRNGNGTAEGKDANGNDIFVETSNNNFSTFGGVTATDVAGSAGTFSWSTGAQTESITVTQSNTYSVTFTDGMGCVATDEVNVQFGSGNVQVNLGPDQSLCNGATIVLDAGPGFASYSWSTSETSQTLEVSLPGDYAVTVTDQSGCSGIDLIHVEVGTSPTANFSYAAVTGTTVSFTDIGSDASIIYWDFNGDGLADDSCSAGGTVYHQFPSASVFGVQMTAVNGCGESVSSQNVLVQDVGIEELKLELGFNSYPNPVVSELYVGVTEISTYMECILVSDVRGREKLKMDVATKKSANLNLSELSNGIYILRIITNNGLITERIIKQ